MSIKKNILIFCFSFFITGCNQYAKDKMVEQNNINTITTVEINILPAFTFSSKILINKINKTVEFIIDTAHILRSDTFSVFNADLASYSSETLIDSFYSQSFLDSIKHKPGSPVILDGLSIYTLIKRANTIDSIDSGNSYPAILSDNIISQLDYISKNSNDESLKRYVTEVKSYFH